MELSIPNTRQLDALRLYGGLIELRESWSGRLVLCCGTGCIVNPIPVAVSIAGGATLAIDADAAAMKSAMRNGELDFVVNSLDEALRTLKNEVRKHRPLSVGLISDTTTALSEMAERGVQPDLLFLGGSQFAESMLGNERIGELVAAGMQLANPDSASFLASDKKLREVYLPSPDLAALREIDKRLLAILSAEDVIRRSWIERAPEYLRDARIGGRWIWLSDEERAQLGV